MQVANCQDIYMQSAETKWAQKIQTQKQNATTIKCKPHFFLTVDQ